MAQELTINGSLSYSDSEGTDISLAIVNLVDSVATKRLVRTKQLVTTSEIAIDFGDVSVLAWAMFVNRDVANYIEIKVATGGAIFAKLLPGRFALLPLGSGAQEPYAIANTASCQMDVIIASL
jgi:hypothetical protein